MSRHYGVPRIRLQPHAPLRAPRFTTAFMTEIMQAGVVLGVVLFWTAVLKFVVGW